MSTQKNLNQYRFPHLKWRLAYKTTLLAAMQKYVHPEICTHPFKKNTFSSIWNLPYLKVLKVKANTLHFFFCSELEVVKATQMGRWYLDNYLIIFSLWKGKLPRYREFDLTHYWVQIHGLSGIIYTVNVADKLLGKFSALVAAQIVYTTNQTSSPFASKRYWTSQNRSAGGFHC